MAPQRPPARKSTSTSASSNGGLASFPAPPRLENKSGDSVQLGTSRKTSIHPKLRISQEQKQALIDNLQLEITERARKLRAQYALQAQGLRTRMEIRIHRIPAALRKITMGELYERHAQKPSKDQPQSTRNVQGSSSNTFKSPEKPVPKLSPSKRTMLSETRPTRKRTSDVFDDDKENASTHPANPNQVKRVRAASPSRVSPQKPSTSANVRYPGARPPSRHFANTSRVVLSPRSNNSRTLPQSPHKAAPSLPTSPYKSNVPRPVSPLKPVASTVNSPVKPTEKPRATTTRARAASRQKAAGASKTGTTRGKKANAEQAQTKEQDEGSAGRTSSASNETSTSAGTTIVKKGARSTRGAPSGSAKVVGGTVRGKTAGVVKRMAAGINAKKAGEIEKPVAATKAVNAAGTILKGGRTLRKRA